jgi:hypothetical protein
MITKCLFKHLVCFRCRLAEFEAEFDANRLLLHISNFGRSVRSQNSTNTTLKNAQKKHTVQHSTTKLVSLVHKGYSSRYLEAHNCTTSGIRAAFKFRELLGCTTYNCGSCSYETRIDFILCFNAELEYNISPSIYL